MSEKLDSLLSSEQLAAMDEVAKAANTQSAEPTPAPLTARAAILNEAMKITHHDRNKQYGAPEDNFQNIANLWNAYLGTAINSADVAIMCMLIKVARLSTNPTHHDSAVDIAGYAACLGEVQKRMRDYEDMPF